MSEQEQDIIRQSALLTYLFRTHITGHTISEVKGDDWPANVGFAKEVLRVNGETSLETLQTERKFRRTTPYGELVYDHFLKRVISPRKPDKESPIKVTPIEGLIVVDLMIHQGQARTYRDLLQTVRGVSKENILPHDSLKIIKVHMTRLRKKLGDIDHELIRTSRGSGYYIPLPDDRLPKPQDGQ